MNKVKVLIKGYATQTENGWLASCSTTLITTPNHKIIVDPGINKKLLLEQLHKESLTPNDIDYVYLTHFHVDHIFLSALFENATFFDALTMYKNDEEYDVSGVIPDTDIKIIETPGHAYEHSSLVVPTEEYGTLVVAADVFWWTDDQEQKTDYESLMSHEDPFTKDLEALRASRQNVWDIADWVIPGHGEMFKVEK